MLLYNDDSSNCYEGRKNMITWYKVQIKDSLGWHTPMALCKGFSNLQYAKKKALEYQDSLFKLSGVKYPIRVCLMKNENIKGIHNHYTNGWAKDRTYCGGYTY